MAFNISGEGGRPTLAANTTFSISPPIFPTSPQENDTHFTTSDGTENGTVIGQYIYDVDSSVWVLATVPDIVTNFSTVNVDNTDPQNPIVTLPYNKEDGTTQNVQFSFNIPTPVSVINSIDLKPTGNANEITIEIVYTDDNGNQTTITDTTPILVGDRYRTTSTTTETIVSNGTLTFQIDTGLDYIPNQEVLIDADGSNFMGGHVDSYDPVTGILVVDIKHKTGTGTYSAWDINLGSVHVEPYVPEESFERTSKNLQSWDYTLAYTAGDLTSITYTDGTSTIVKTLTYTLGDLTSIVLSGDTPAGIDLTKTLIYTAGNLTNITYS